MKRAKTLLITGGSSGIGKATVEVFEAHGWQVYELSRHGRIACDVTNPESVKQAVAKVMNEVEWLDVVISNAGYGISGSIEFTDIEDAKRQFDVNFFGAFNLTQAVLPYLRKQQGGRLLFTSSVAAVLPIPYQSFYSATKAALNAYALALQNEVRPWGIEVAVLMPGDVQTGFTAARKKELRGSDIYTHMTAAVERMEKDEQTGIPAAKIAAIYYHMATRRHLSQQYIGGGEYKIFCFLDRLLPKRLVNWIVGKLYS